MASLDDELREAARADGNPAPPVAVPKDVPAPAAPKRSLGLLVALLVMVLGIVVLVLSFKESAVYAKSVDQIANDPHLVGRALRVEGNLVKGSLVHQESPCEYRFRMSSNGAEMPVRYANCVVPDTFRDVPGMDVKVTVEGKVTPSGQFEASLVMAKCPSKYEMKERATKGENAPHDAI
jgi:cytochrome c-type biogenesis protein CcmE